MRATSRSSAAVNTRCGVRRGSFFCSREPVLPASKSTATTIRSRVRNLATMAATAVAAAQPGVQRLRFVTYNVRRFTASDGSSTVAEVATALRMLEPAFVCLNEVDLDKRPGALETLARDLGGYHVEFFGHVQGKAGFDKYGNALLSRYPPVSSTLCLPACLPVCLSVCLSVSLSLSLSLSHSVSRSLCLSLSLSLFPSLSLCHYRWALPAPILMGGSRASTRASHTGYTAGWWPSTLPYRSPQPPMATRFRSQ